MVPCEVYRFGRELKEPEQDPEPQDLVKDQRAWISSLVVWFESCPLTSTALSFGPHHACSEVHSDVRSLDQPRGTRPDLLQHSQRVAIPRGHENPCCPNGRIRDGVSSR